MPYLRKRDYIKTIQEANLLQIINSDDNLRLEAEVAAQAEVIGYLSQKYDTTDEFRDTTIWDFTKTYKGKDLVELFYADYVAANTYTANSLMVFTDGYVYISTGAVAANQTPITNPSLWTKLGLKYALFYVTLPEKEFDYKAYYKRGDKVFWKDKTYTALKDTPLLDQFTALQYGRSSNLPMSNTFPDDPIFGADFWGTGTAYSVAANTLPTVANKWTPGDNRSALIVQKTVDICLYHLHSRIAPRNIPQLRITRYDHSIEYLTNIAKGNNTADLPLLQPKTNGMMRIASDIKRQNDY